MSWQRHLIIDGYNIIHAWSDVRRYLRGAPEVAVSQLAERVRVIHDIESTRVTIVLDSKNKEVTIDRPTKETTFSLLYAPAETSADGLIEQLVLSSKTPKLLTVATADNMIINAARSVAVVTVSPQGLLEWVEACEARQAQALRREQGKARQQWKEDSPWKL